MHAAESVASPHPWVHSFFTKEGNYTYDVWAPAGEALYSARAASVHTEIDGFGWRPPSPYSASRYTDRRPMVDYSYVDSTGSKCSCTSHVHNPLGILNQDWALLSQLRAEAEVLALGKFATGSVDLSVAFLERKQTASMISDWCMASVRLLKDLRKGRWVKSFRSSTTKSWRWNKNVPRGWTPKAVQQWREGRKITTLPNAWLTTRYGIAPSLMDIAGSVEAIENADQGKFDRYIATNHSRRFEVKSWVEPKRQQYFGLYYVIPAFTWETHYRKHEAHVRLDATIDNSFYLTLQDVGLTNPLLTGWEVIPYSFVLDWFVGVGDFLSAVNAFNQGYSFKAGSSTIHWDLSSDGYVSIDKDRCADQNFLEPTLSLPYSARVAASGFVRNVYSSPPFPTLVVKRDPLNVERMWDSIFLLSNLVGNKGAASKAKDRMRNLRI